MLIVSAVVPGVAGAAVFGYYALVDYWHTLQAADQEYKAVLDQSSGLETIFVAQTNQNIHWLNLFGDGT
ncbi:MAG: hypothetical protein AAFW95_00650 [Cyanobacteria bacterium J06638_6]